MHIIAPHISCIAFTEAELTQAIAEGYAEIYCQTKDGIVKHHKLRDGAEGRQRYLRIKVPNIPGIGFSDVKQEINFLPAGKIPYELFEQVLAFFKKVMEVKKAELEAMIWIVWNAERGYHLCVPNQTISKASVNYDWSSLPSGTSMVCDIHSHNTMGAFFSGTDNNDDRGAIGYSGVVGRINDPEPATVWRFNYKDQKFEVKLSDIFVAPERPEIEIPKEWLDQVKTHTYHYPAVQRYLGNQTNHGSGKGKQHRKDNFHLSNDASSNNIRKGPADHVREYNDWLLGRGVARSDSEGYHMGGHEPNFQGDFWGLSDPLTGMISEGEADARLTAAERSLVITEDTSLPEVKSQNNLSFEEIFMSCGDPEGRPVIIVDPEDADPVGSMGEEYEMIASAHGVDVADAFDAINDGMAFLDGHDDLMSQCMNDMFNLLAPEAKAKVFRDFYENLPSSEQDKLAQNGF